MTSNDKQIDVLMRRYGKAAPHASVSGHLDADELSAFAEGALPPATRASYVSHLADCDECRKRASSLAISSGAVVRTEESPFPVGEGRTFWQVIAGMFALPVLRYAAFAAVVLIVAGVAFVALRRPSSNRSLIAQNESANEEPQTAVKPSNEEQLRGGVGKAGDSGTRSASPTQPGLVNDQTTKANAARPAEDVPVNPVPMKEAAPAAPPVTAEKKAGEGEMAKAAPSYAPVPPGDAMTQQKQEAYRQSQSGAGISGPRQQQKVDSVDKLQDRERDANKDLRADDAARKDATQSVASNQLPPSPRRAVDEKAKGPMRNMENNTMNRNETLGRVEAPKTTSNAGADKASTEEAPQTRSAGGKKFRKQNGAWVDQKFKSSMTLRTVSRESDEFDDLDSGLRSIAQQLGGEIIVVWKGKAYLIK